MAGTTVIEVPENDPLCFFVRLGRWSDEDHRPKANALKGDKKHTYSTWHIEGVHALGDKLGDLAIGPLTNGKQRKIIARDFIEAASPVLNPQLQEIEPEFGQRAPGELKIQVLFRPGDENVDLPWRKWREAHCQVEHNISTASPNFPQWYRKVLAKRGSLICDV